MSSVTDQLGRVLAGRYRLVAPIGTGASAHVYAADDTVLSRRVAVKVLHPALAGDQGFLRRFRAEAQAAASLNHPHVMRVFDWGEDQDGPFLVLEYLGGGSLRDLLDAGHLLTPSQAAVIGAEAAHGLAYAHRRGFVHRDIKPANILFDEEGSLRVADFGLARALAEAAWTEPIGAVLGTARYASPEQAEGKVVNDRSDVYSLALVLFEAITGWVPFTADTTVATLMARMGAHIPVVPSLGLIGPVLAQAAIPEPIARLDAAALAIDLELARREMAPAAPIPVVGIGGPALGDRDPTMAGVVAPVPPSPAAHPAPVPTAPFRPAVPARAAVPARPAVPARAPAAAAAAATTAPAATAATAQPVADRRPAPKPKAPRRPRRLAKVAAWSSAVLLAALAAAGSVVGVMAYRHHLSNRYAVPAVEGVTPSYAEHLAAGQDLQVLVVGHAYSTVLAAGEIVTQSLSPGSVAPGGSVIRVTVSAGLPPVGIPSLTGDDQSSASQALSRVGLQYVAGKPQYSETVQVGHVVSWSPQAGDVKHGTPVTVVLSLGPRPRVIPTDLAGAGYQAAASQLAGEQLVPVEQLQYSNSWPKGEVIGTYPGGGQSAQRGSSVTVYVSKGPEYVTIPFSIEGMSVPQAEQWLTSHGLVPAGPYGPSSARVFITSPIPGTTVKVGSQVAVYTSFF